jgi:hypothetical protein
VVVHRDLFMPPFRLPVAEAIEQVVRHLGMHFEYKPGEPERAVLSLGRTNLGGAVTGSAISDAPKT